MKTILTAGLLSSLIPAFAADHATFRAEDIDTKIEIGYGLAIADVNGDKKPDILLADKKQIVWYEAPNWTKHIIAENLTPQDNVCIAAQDIDGDGKAEVAVGAGWNPSDTVNSGALFYLIPPADRTQKWEPFALHHEPTIHRIKWVKGPGQAWGLVSVPLHGRGNKNGEGAPVKHEFYDVPTVPSISAPISKNIRTDWRRTLIDEEMHMTHNFDVPKFQSQFPELLIAGKEGIYDYTFLSIEDMPTAEWGRSAIVTSGQQGFAGAGEVRVGKMRAAAFRQNKRFIAAIEPMHGSNVVLYLQPKRGSWVRTVLDSSLVEGHALQCADFLGRGSDQFVVGWRGKLGAPAGSSSTGVKLFIPDKDGKNWTQQMIDDKGMACEDLAVADLNGDGKPDIVAAGRATKNVRIYWNETK
jgi:hypothetical protein